MSKIMELASDLSCAAANPKGAPNKEWAALKAEVSRMEAELASATAGWQASLKHSIELLNERDALAAKLQRIADLDPEKDSDDGFNEWGQAYCFDLAQTIAKEKTT